MMPKSYNPKETEELLLSDVKKKGQFKRFKLTIKRSLTY
jgi:hypothetical protein